MAFTLNPGQQAKNTIFPEAADGSQTQATLANIVITFDQTLVSIVTDPTDPTGRTIVATALDVAGESAVHAQADATDPDGTVTSVGGDLDPLDVVIIPPPPPPTTQLGSTGWVLVSPTPATSIVRGTGVLKSAGVKR